MANKNKQILSHIAILTMYTILALIFTYPLIVHITTHILGDGFDGNQFPIAFWWIKKAVLELKANPLYTDYLFYPMGTSLVFHTTTLLNALMGIPLQYVFGLTATVNIFCLLTFILSAYGAFLLIDYLTQQKIAAFIGGFAFGFCPYRLMSAMGFHNLLDTQWIPLYILFLLKLTKEQTYKNSLWTALFLLCTALNSYNYAIFLGIFTIIYLLHLIVVERTSLSIALLKRGTLFLGLFLIAFSPILFLAYQELSMYGDVVSGEVVGTDVLAYFVPSILHPLWGNMAWRIYPRLTPYIAMTTVYTGITLTSLALYAGLALRKSRRVVINFWVICAGTFFVLSLGPTLQLYGQHVLHVGRINFAVPLPYALLLKVPILGGGIRIAARFSIIVTLALSVLAGYTVAFIQQRFTTSQKWFQWVLIVVIGGGLACEYLTFPYPRLYEQKIPATYYEIAKDPDDVSILQIPLQVTSGVSRVATGSPELDLCQTVHQKPLIGGYISRASPHLLNYFAQAPLLGRLIRIQKGESPSAEDIQQDKQLVKEFLQFYRLKYIVLHKKDRIGMGFFMGSVGPILNNLERYVQEVFPIDSVTIDEDADVITYTLRLEPAIEMTRIDFGTPSAHFELGSYWSKDERWDGDFTFNWAIHQQSLLLLRFQHAEEQRCTVRVSPFSYPNAPQQVIKVFLNRRFVTRQILSPSWQEYTFLLPARSVLPGINKLHFEYRYAQSPLDVLGVPDKRNLSVAFDYLECVSTTQNPQ